MAQQEADRPRAKGPRGRDMNWATADCPVCRRAGVYTIDSHAGTALTRPSRTQGVFRPFTG